MDTVHKIVEELMDPKNNLVVDGFILNKVDSELYERLLNKAKELEPTWQEYTSIEVYIPEDIHFIAYAKSMVERRG